VKDQAQKIATGALGVTMVRLPPATAAQPVERGEHLPEEPIAQVKAFREPDIGSCP